MKHKTARGVGLECVSCGGRFPLGTLAGGARCPFCGARQPMDGTAILAAKQYRQKVEELRRPRAWVWEVRLSTLARRLAIASLVPAAVTTPLFIFGAVTGLADGINGWVKLLFLLLHSGSSSLAVTAIVLLASDRGGRRKARREPTGIKVSCPHCGGANHLAVGQAVGTCTYCDGALVPGQAAIGRGIHAAQDEAFLHALRHRASWRATMQRGYNQTSPTARALHMILLALTFASIPGFVVVGVVASTGLVLGGALVGLVLLGLLAWFSVVVLCWRRSELDAQAEQAAQLGLLAGRVGGQARASVSRLAVWMNLHWHGNEDTDLYEPRPRFGAVSFGAAGYPGVVVLAINPPLTWFAGSFKSSLVRVLLAATLDEPARARQPWRHGAAEARVRWLLDAGFMLQFLPEGIVAIAQHHVVTRLSQDISAVQQLPAVLEQLGALARDIGASPVPPAQIS